MEQQMFYKETIYLDLAAGTADEMIDLIYKDLLAMGFVTKEFQEAVKLRERSFPTGLPGSPYDIAVPHTDPDYIRKPFIALIRPKATIPFVQMGSQDIILQAKLIFLLGFKSGTTQVKLLQNIIDLFVQGGRQQPFLSVSNRTDCLALLREYIHTGQEVSV